MLLELIWASNKYGILKLYDVNMDHDMTFGWIVLLTFSCERLFILTPMQGESSINVSYYPL